MRVSLDKRPEEQVIELLHQPGGYEALGHLIGINPEKLTSAGRIDYLAALERQHSWLTSLIQNATLAIAGSEPSQSENLWEGVDEAEREDVATALRLSANTAQSRIDTARVLTNHLPATCQALAVGDISPSHATLIARETSEAIKRGISTEDLIHIENRALAHAEFHTPAQVGRKIRTLIAQISPETFEESVAIARDTRSVHMYPESDGMATVIALLPAEDAQTVMLAINTLVETQSSLADSRSIEMKRADALAAICGDILARISDEHQPHRRPVTINITMDLPTALGMADNPAELAGYGPIPASVARTLSADAKWRRFITDPLTGNLLDYGRETYVPPQPLVDFLTARDRICRFPGCSQPSRISDIDHAIPWEEGGPTSPTNLGLLCRRHHRMKTHNGWKLMSHEDGSCTWTSPAGKEIFVPSRPIHESA
ncbi:MAG: HNH endonuclease [Actinobacteria bacterium]|jgi:hypothetical protein|nr:HNH endonuclease [Actinomycetota bacterium]NCU89216.1 HNH endonuclease [Actinomycetota bacterium]NDE54609.1 HNH endonuclease [Actinomycetota bacterium]